MNFGNKTCVFSLKENSSTPINKDEKQLTPNFNSQLSQESISNSGKTIERQSSQPASSSYTASQTYDEFRSELFEKNDILMFVFGLD